MTSPSRPEIEELIAELKNGAFYTDLCGEIVQKTPTERDRFIAAALESLKAENDGLLDILSAIKRHGELGNVNVGSLWGSSGKKPPSKDVWQFPRHMLTEIDEALAARAFLTAQEGKNNG